MIRALLVDDQQLLRRGLRLLLETVPGIEVVGEASDGREALAHVEKDRPDIVLCDVRMPGMDGLSFLAACQRLHPGLPVLMLTTFDDEPLVRGALGAGASGYLLKDVSVEGLSDAIRAVADGGMVIDPRVARIALNPAVVDADDPLAVLTRAERAVAELVAIGASNAEIAAQLVLAEGTVKNHVSSLLRKLDARDRTVLALRLNRAINGGGSG